MRLALAYYFFKRNNLDPRSGQVAPERAQSSLQNFDEANLACTQAKEHSKTLVAARRARAYAWREFNGVLAALILGCSCLGLAACQTQGELVQQENSLAEAGFAVQIANTAERQAMLNRLPPNQFVLRVRDGVSHYVYADPGCGCLYVGSQQAFNQYVSNQQLDFSHEQQMAVQDYYDAAWDWAAWGPWGPLGPLYGPGIGGW